MLTKAQEYAGSLAALNTKSSSIFSRLYALKSMLLENGPFNVQTDRDLLRFRFKVEKMFPDLPNLEKIKGIEQFDAQAEHIVKDLTNYAVEISSVCSHLQSLSAFLRSNFINKYNLKFNRVVMNSWMEAFSTYVKIMFLLESMPEKFELLSLYYAAKHLVGDGGEGPNESVLKPVSFRFLVEAFADDIRRHFITRFSLNQQTIFTIIRESQPIIVAWTNPSVLYEHFDVFNTEVLLQQSQFSLLPHPSTFSELCRVHQHCEFLALAVIACPYLLYEQQVVKAVEMVTQQVFIFTIFRDLTFDVHLELEKSFFILEKLDLLSTNNKDPTLQLIPKPPKQFKSATILKSISRNSITNAGMNQQKRRHFLMFHIEEAIDMIKLIPAVIAPKFSTLFTLTWWLQREICMYYAHFPPFAMRKDTKSYRNVNHYQAIDIAQALQTLTNAIAVMTASHSKVHHFHLQVLLEINVASFNQFRLLLSRDNDTATTTRAEEEESAVALIAVINSIHESLTLLSSSSTSSSQSIINAQDKNAESEFNQTVTQLFTLISDAIHLTSYQQSKQPPIEADILSTLLEHLSHVQITTQPLSLILKLDPFPAAWHRVAWEKSFTIALRQGHGILTFFGPFESILLNILHENIVTESSISKSDVLTLGQGAIFTFNSMLLSLTNYLKRTFQLIWDRFSDLEQQYLGQEAASRIEKMKKEVGSSFGPLPGFESEIWAEGPLLGFAQQQLSLLSILKMIRNKHVIRVFTQEIDIPRFVVLELQTFFHDKCSTIIYEDHHRNHNPEEELPQLQLRRFSESLHHFEVGVKFLREMCVVLELNVDDEMLVDMKQREIFGMMFTSEKMEMEFVKAEKAKNNGDLETGAEEEEHENDDDDDDEQDYLHPNSPLPLFINTREGTMIHDISTWFVDLIDIIAAPGSLLVYLPSEKSFVSFRNILELPVHNALHMTTEYNYKTPVGNSHEELMIDLYLSPPELQALAKLIGVTGMRILQAKIFGVLIEKLDAIIAFIQENGAYLRILKRDYCFSVISAQNLQVDVFAQTLKIVGISFALLELLTQATGEVAENNIIPELYEYLTMTFQSLHYWQHPQHKKDEQTVDDFLHLAHTLGVDNSLQATLFLSMLNCRSWLEEEISALEMLPLAMAAVFGNAVWDNLQYHLPFEVFMGNEHCTQLALARLFPLVNALKRVILPVANDDRQTVKEQAFNTSNRVKSNEDWHKNEQAVYKQYLMISTQCLLTRRNSFERSKSTFKAIPFPALFQQLKLFVQLSSPTVTMAQLEECLPHDFVQFGLIDMAMGKFTAADRYVPLRRMVQQEEDNNTRMLTTDD